MKKLLILLLSTIVLSACSSNITEQNPKYPIKKIDLTISAAASLDDALTEIKSDYQKKHKNVNILLNLGGSGTLQQQIMHGAPADLFISAGEKQYKVLVEKGLIDKQNSGNLLKNQLVLVTNAASGTSIHSIADLTKASIKKMAIGTPESVPAGLYAKQTLQSEGIWDVLNSNSKIVLTKDVRQVLTYVETGNVDAGLVYMTDAKVSKKVKVAAIASETSHEPITYPAGVVKATHHKKDASQFFRYLESKEARGVFERYGFQVLPK